MLLRYFYDKKLAHASYPVGCQKTGEAIVIDPGRNLKPYLQAAKEEGRNITAAAETHIHADFVSGARELGATHQAKLYLSDEGDANWKYQYVDESKHQLVKDGDRFSIGNLMFEVMHTPGHTPESISFLLTDGGEMRIVQSASLLEISSLQATSADPICLKRRRGLRERQSGGKSDVQVPHEV